MAPRPAAPVVAGLAALIASLACTGPGEDQAIPGEADTLAAGPEPAAVRADLDEAFELGYDVTAVVGEGRATIEFRRLAEESRCPADARCVTAGNAAVELAIETGDGAAATLVLNTDRTPAEASVHGLTVRLRGLEPAAPGADAAIDTADYVATLVVTESGPPADS